VTLFEDSNTAGNATISNINGSTSFYQTSTGGNARLVNGLAGSIDLSFNLSTGVTAGSIEGAGNIFLGSKNLAVGSNNLSTEFSGVIQYGGPGGGTGGSLTKTGTGVLTLSGVDTYTGGTTITGGMLAVTNDNNLGDAAGGLTFNGGTLRTMPVGGPVIVIARDITLQAGGGTIEAAGETGLTGNITGTGGLTKTGILQVSLSGTNSYSGATNVLSGSLQARLNARVFGGERRHGGRWREHRDAWSRAQHWLAGGRRRCDEFQRCVSGAYHRQRQH
jgi:autotransporter-associated beta strand protein